MDARLERAEAFEAWLASLPTWLQEAACDLIARQSRPSPDDIAAYAQRCCAEAVAPCQPDRAVPKGEFGLERFGEPVRLQSVGCPENINALNSSTVLEFGDASLAIVYGANGAGKSGYSRLIKFACGARDRQPILRDAFASQNGVQAATFAIARGANTRVLRWQLDDQLDKELRRVHIFDADTATFYLTQKNEARYEPRPLRFISTLVAIADAVRGAIAEERLRLLSRLPTIPASFAGTPAAIWLAKLSERTSDSSIDDTCALSADQAARKAAIQIALAEADPAKQLAAEKARFTQLDQLRQQMHRLVEAYSRESVLAIRSLTDDARRKRLVADEAARACAGDRFLPGVGSETWKAMWEAAKRYSEQIAYPGVDFPVTSSHARCVLCQQALNVDSGERLTDLSAFVSARLEREAVAAEAKLASALSAVPQIPSLDTWGPLCTAAGLAAVVGSTFHTRLVLAAAAMAVPDQPMPDEYPTEATDELAAHRAEREVAISTLEKLVSEGGRNSLERELRELNATEWLATNKVAIQDEVNRLQAIERLKVAERKAATNELTRKKNELSEVEIASGYRERFEQELKALGASRLRVEPTANAEGKGRVSFSIDLRDCVQNVGTVGILSEGEARIAALAAFLADMRGADSRDAFVFDDPVSSLDADFEDAVATRLMEIAKTRQVIVLTHRLSLVSALENAASGIGNEDVSVRKLVLRRLGNLVGIITSATTHESNVRQALNALKERSQKAQKAFEAGDFDEYGTLIKSVCSELRIVVERCVESVLLNEVVLRFRRGVQTQGRLKDLAKITTSDCVLIDAMIAKYSCFEHSQSAEIAGEAPQPQAVIDDIDHIAKWVSEFKKRTVEHETAPA
jgi:hypothetical protein